MRQPFNKLVCVFLTLAIAISYPLVCNAEYGYTNLPVTLYSKRSHVPVASISLNKKYLELEVGGFEKLEAIITPENASDKLVYWESEDSEIASVNAEGKVVAHKPGTTNIIATSNDSLDISKCLVVVLDNTIKVSGINLNRKNLILCTGTSDFLYVNIEPENATNKEVEWKSSDENIVSVDNDGRIEALAAGSAEITATSEDSSKADKCSISVQDNYVAVSSIILSHSGISLTPETGKTIEAILVPSFCSNKNIIWASDDPSVATVDDGYIFAIKTGRATITATSEDGGFCQSCIVYVADPPVSHVPVTGLSLSHNYIELEEGKTADIIAKIAPPNASDPSIIWESYDSEVAEISQTGVVTAIREGHTKVSAIATDGLWTETCEIVVKAREIPVPVSQITLNYQQLYMNPGMTKTISAEVMPENATDKTLVWHSAENSVAQVSGDGFVEAMGVGQTIVTASSKDGKASSNCKIIVENSTIPVAYLKADVEELLLKTGEKAHFKVDVVPINATDKSLTYSSDNSSVAYVDNNGLVTALAEGFTVIRASTKQGLHKAKCMVYVSSDIVPVAQIQLNMKTKVLSKTSGKFRLKATVYPANSSFKEVIWYTENPKVAVVDKNGFVTVKKAGKAVIKACCGDKQASMTVSAGVKNVPVSKIAITPKQSALNVGSAIQLSARIFPAKPSNKNITWASSAPEIASISSKGKLIAKSPGKAVITATTHDGGKISYCSITVKPAARKISFVVPSMVLAVGKSAKLKTKTEPAQAAGTVLVYKSNAPRIVSVNAKGQIKALKKGKAAITVCCGKKKASCTVTVK